MQFIVRYLWLTVLRSPITIPSFIHFKFDLANRRIIRFQSKQHKQPLRTHSNGRECALRSHRERNANLYASSLDAGAETMSIFMLLILARLMFIVLVCSLPAKFCMRMHRLVTSHLR